MKDFHSRKKKNPFIYSPFFFILVLFVLVILIKSAVSSYQKKIKAQTENEKYSEEFLELSEKKKYYEAEIQRLNTDEGKIAEFKKTNDYDEPGVTVIHIVNSEE
jgi:cell division protein FtsB